MDPWVILTFGSLQDLSEFIENEITKSKQMISGYNERIGLLLRQDPKKEEKKIKPNNSGKKWIPYGSLKLYGGHSQKGEAEILFETVDDLNNRIQKLENATKGVTNLSKIGLGETPIFIIQLKNSIPMKVIISKPTSEDRPRLKYEAELIIPSKSHKSK